MDTRAKIGLGVGGAVIALGAAVGVGALAANLGGANIPPAQNGFGQDGRAGGDGTRARGGMDTAALATTLATKLGVDETKMAAALREVMTANQRPDVETMATALATTLNLDQAKVLAALQEAMPAHQ